MRHSAQEERANAKSAPATPRQSVEPDRCSRGNDTESGRFGDVELVDVGDSTPDFTEFVAQQARAAHEHDQHCILVTMLPKCPGCAALGYAIEKGLLSHALGKIRIVRLDLDEFEEEVGRLHLPIDRVPGFILLDPSGATVDFLDAGEWNSNDPAEFAPVIAAFVYGRLSQRRHFWSRIPHSQAIDL